MLTASSVQVSVLSTQYFTLRWNSFMFGTNGFWKKLLSKVKDCGHYDVTLI